MAGDEDELGEVIATIKSILTKERSLKELESDFFQFMETSIPYKKYGYNSAIDFLEQKVGCTCRQDARGLFMISCWSEKSSHIAKLIEEQEATARSMGRGKQRSARTMTSSLRLNASANYGSRSDIQRPMGGPSHSGYDHREISINSRPYTGSLCEEPGALPKYRETQRELVLQPPLSQPKKLPAATDVIAMLSKTNKQLIGREVTLDEYLEQLEREHGSAPIAFLKQRHQTSEKIMNFIANNSCFQSPVDITGSGKLKIKGSEQTIGTAVANGDHAAAGTEYSFLNDVPYSTAFKHELIRCKEEVHAVVSLFTGGPQLHFHFTTMDEAGSRETLITHMNSTGIIEGARIPSHVYLGMPCLGMDTTTTSRQYHRAVVIRKKNNQVTLYFVDSGVTDDACIEDLREIPRKFLEDRVYSHPGIVGLIKPIQNQKDFKIHVAQRLSVNEGDVVQIKILSHNKQCHVVDLDVLVRPLIEEGLIQRDSMANDITRKTETKYSISVEMLATMNNFYIVTTSETNDREVLVPTACISDIFGLEGDTILADLERTAFIKVSKILEAHGDNARDLYRQLTEAHCPHLSTDRKITLIPIESVAPLLKAYECIFMSKEVQKILKLIVPSILKFCSKYKQ